MRIFRTSVIPWFVTLGASALVALAVTAAPASAAYLSMSEAKASTHRLLRQIEVKTDADDSYISGCFREAESVIFCRANVLYSGQVGGVRDCSDLVRVGASDGWIRSKTMRANCS